MVQPWDTCEMTIFVPESDQSDTGKGMDRVWDGASKYWATWGRFFQTQIFLWTICEDNLWYSYIVIASKLEDGVWGYMSKQQGIYIYMKGRNQAIVKNTHPYLNHSPKQWNDYSYKPND